MELLGCERSHIVHDNEQKQYLKKKPLLLRFDIEMMYNLKGKNTTRLLLSL